MARGFSCLGRWRGFSFRRASRRGSVATEFALLAFPFFVLLVGVSELCLIETAQQLLENAAFNASRLGKTGYVAEGATQAETVEAVLTKELSSYGLLIDTSKLTTTQERYNSFVGASSGGGASGYGSAQEIVIYTVAYPWKVFTPLMCSLMGAACNQDTNTVMLTSTIVVRNEPYG
ncbi:MAG: pilus assembly protein [Alphaproteobacteria bacterium]|nr:pilus assembly protein [Alphaproteobacteria bacterium]